MWSWSIPHHIQSPMSIERCKNRRMARHKRFVRELKTGSRKDQNQINIMVS